MYGCTLCVWGDYALFTRPEMKAERVSYDVMTPSAARGILEAIHWKPAIRWVVDEIWVLNEIKFSNIRRNEVKSKITDREVNQAMKTGQAIYLNASSSEERQQRAALVLKDVAYVIKAHFELTDRAGERDNEAKHHDIFMRRARKGQCYMQPYLGCREFPAHFRLIEVGEPDYKPIALTKDLGYMLYDLDYGHDDQPVFFRAQLEEGVLRIPEEVKKKVQL